MALRGTLQDFSLADIFQLIGIQKKTGVLSLKSDKETCTVSFVDGQVVGADSSARRLEDRLGNVLVKSGRVSDAQLQDALRIQKSTLKRLGNVLVENNLIDKQALSDALHIQISQMIYRLFRWTAGEYNFSQEEKVDYDKDLVVPMSAESILMEGARILDEWPMVEKGIRSFTAVYRRADVEIARKGSPAALSATEEAAGAVTLSGTEQQIYDLVDGRRPVQELVERSMLSEFETCRTLYELISRQILEEVQVQAPVRGPAAPRGKGQPQAPAVKRRAARGSIVPGLVTMALILLGGGAVLYRVLPWAGAARMGASLPAWLSPYLSEPQTMQVALSMGRGRVQAIDFALQVYYLLNRGYPAELKYLVTEGLIRPEALNDTLGEAIHYEVVGNGYRLSIVD